MTTENWEDAGAFAILFVLFSAMVSFLHDVFGINIVLAIILTIVGVFALVTVFFALCKSIIQADVNKEKYF